MRASWIVWGVAVLGSLTAQESAADVAARVRQGGWFEQSKYRRADDGSLEVWTTAHTGSEELGEFLPLIDRGDAMATAIDNLGLLGLLSLVCHGDADLLAMTDAGFHFGALGIDGSDVGLRQFLALPSPSFEGARGRAELLDRLLAIDRLEHRRVAGAVAEFRVLAARADVPAALRERAAQALRTLRNGTGVAAPVRQRLDAQALALPLAFDACIVIDHARLPDLRWLAPLGRRTGALVTAATIEAAGGTVSPPACNGAQRMCDVAAGAPFWFAHRYGNLRFDQSLVTITAKGDGRNPIAATWNACGAFEAAGWQDFALPDEGERDKQLGSATARLTTTTLFASTDGSRGKPRPELVEKLALLRDDGLALRAVVPANSKLWAALAFVHAPPTQGGEIRVVFGDPAVITIVAEARDEEAAAAWVAKGKELVEQGDGVFAMAAEPIAATRGFQLLREAWLGAAFSVKDTTAFATVIVRGFTPQHVRELVEAAALVGF
ncbi:MAG: hypothetical protein FJ265_12015 [Planctomycetes bacterium]|nr:hypothetical protein [Planctomycetota bacterium]